MTSLPVGRSCGGCTACCKTHTSKVIKDSWNGVWCRYCRPSGEYVGCWIYEDRPKCCREYRCFWLQGSVGDETRRPDRIGIVVDGSSVSFEERTIKVINLWEVERGKCDQDFVLRFTEKQIGLGFIVCHRLMFLPKPTEKRYFFPEAFTPEERERFAEFAKDRIM